MRLFSKLTAAAFLGLAASPLLALNATCTLYDANGVGWKADLSILDYVVDDVAVISADVKHSGGCYGSGMDYVSESSQDIAWFDAGGARHYFYSDYMNWGYMSEGGYNTCQNLVTYAALTPNC